MAAGTGGSGGSHRGAPKRTNSDTQAAVRPVRADSLDDPPVPGPAGSGHDEEPRGRRPGPHMVLSHGQSRIHPGVARDQISTALPAAASKPHANSATSRAPCPPTTREGECARWRLRCRAAVTGRTVARCPGMDMGADEKGRAPPGVAVSAPRTGSAAARRGGADRVRGRDRGGLPDYEVRARLCRPSACPARSTPAPPRHWPAATAAVARATRRPARPAHVYRRGSAGPPGPTCEGPRPAPAHF